MKPTMMVVRLQQQGIICASPVSNVDSNADLNFGGGGSGPSRARSHGDAGWDDE